MKKTIPFILFLTLLLSENSSAQSFTPSVIGSAGTYATSSGGSMAWTIGEIMVETYSGTNNFFTQGFHQPDTATITLVQNYSFSTFAVYPNPTSGVFFIDLPASLGNYMIEVFDAQGKLIKRESISTSIQTRHEVSIGEFANGIYLLNISNQEANIFNFFKINKAE
jgi:hypothetical protein